MDQFDIVTLCRGKAIARVNDALGRVVDNILDPDTEIKRKRKLTLTLTFAPSEKRDAAAVAIEVKVALAPPAPDATIVYVAAFAGVPMAREGAPPEQRELFPATEQGTEDPKTRRPRPS